MQKLAKKLILLFGLALLIAAPVVYGQSTSPNYRVDEYFFGTGGELDASSDSYRARQTLGELGVGDTRSDNYRALAGFNTPDVPFLEFYTDVNDVDMGMLSTLNPGIANATFEVSSYLSNGYVVINAADPPRYGSYTVNTPSTPETSQSGTEQFGINLVENTGPTTFGANPNQFPDITFGFGQAANGYNQPNNFKYEKNDTIAFSDVSSGLTQYTISYIFNIDDTTPGGLYVFDHDLVVVAMY